MKEVLRKMRWLGVPFVLIALGSISLSYGGHRDRVRASRCSHYEEGPSQDWDSHWRDRDGWHRHDPFYPDPRRWDREPAPWQKGSRHHSRRSHSGR